MDCSRSFRNGSDISIFEIGKTYYREFDEYKEKTKLAILLSGNYYLDITKFYLEIKLYY